MKKLPLGCDQQGRYPEAAEAATDVGVPDEDAPQQDIVRVVLTDIALSAVLIAVVAGVVLWVAR